MKRFSRRNIFVLLGLAIVMIVCSMLMSYDDPVDFNTDVKPIINKKCISCHGGVKKQGGFSLLFHEEALAVNKSGKAAIIPGNPEESELIKRLLSDDPELRMPYKHEALSDEEIDVFKRWIKEMGSFFCTPEASALVGEYCARLCHIEGFFGYKE